VLSAQPRQPLQARAPLYLKEFVRRHPDEAWSLVSEEAAQAAVGAILPALLAELRGQNPQRWQEAIQKAPPGTRLFQIELGVLCATGELDSVERAMVSAGLRLEDSEVVHLSAQALLGTAQSALAPGLASVFATLSGRPTDARLWELTLDAFVRWGEPLLSAPAGEEPDPEIRAAAGELLRLLRTSAGALSWDQGPHTRQLATVLALFAVAIPHTLKSWMRQEWSPATDDAGSDAALSSARIREIMRLVSKSPAAPFWQKQFAEWMTDEPDLAIIGARGLSQLSGMADPSIAPLIMRIAQQPTDSSQAALSELIGSCGSSPRFVADALTLLRYCKDAPQAYGLLEREIIATLAPADGASVGAAEGRKAALRAIDSAAQDLDLPQSLRDTLARAREAVQGAIEEGLLRGEGR